MATGLAANRLMVYCENCGLANREGSNYCNACGQSLVATNSQADEPLPTWLREATVAGYLWKGELLLPDWLSSVKPFREIYGGNAVVLPPPYSEIEEAPTSVRGAEVTPADAEEISFLDVDEEDGAVEADLLVLDDLDATLSAGENVARVENEGLVSAESAARSEAVNDDVHLDDESPLVSEMVQTPETVPIPLPSGDPLQPVEDREELIVEVIAETLSDTEPEPLLDLEGQPVPVLQVEPQPDEQLVAVVSVEPEDEALLSGVVPSEAPVADSAAEAAPAVQGVADSEAAEVLPNPPAADLRADDQAAAVADEGPTPTAPSPEAVSAKSSRRSEQGDAARANRGRGRGRRKKKGK